MTKGAKGADVVIGIDFGTTFSGIAWALGDSLEDIEVVSSWPGGNNRTASKVPSILAYRETTTQWGYQVGPFQEAIRGVKLLLDESQETKYGPSLSSESLLRKYGKDAVQVSGEFLKHLVTHAKSTLQRRFGGASANMGFKYIFTVPAVWSDKAKDATLKAALMADIKSDEVFLVSEPEAAALYSLRSIQPNSVTRNDVLLVCDAGGGTVDLISYIVKEIEPLELEEATEGTGALCGSLLLDQRFERLLKSKMGPSNYSALSAKAKESAMSHWREMVKPNFIGQFDDEFADVDYFIPLPGAVDNTDSSIQDGFLQLDRNEIEEVFEPIISDIENLVQDQLDNVVALGRNAKAVVLVGGFGSSEYLFQRLQKLNPFITILQPQNAWAAIVRGAVHRGLEGNQVGARVSRRWYGVKHDRPFDPTVDNENEKKWCSLEEKWSMHGVMAWYVKKSEKLRENKPIKFDFYRAIQVSKATNLVFKDQLFFCNDKCAPGSFTDGVLQLCTLESDLREVPQHLFTRKRNSKGVEYFLVNYTLSLVPTSAALFFELQFNGTPYGSVRSKY